MTHPSTLHDVSLQIFGRQNKLLDGLHELCAGGQDPAEGDRAEDNHCLQLSSSSKPDVAQKLYLQIS